MDNYNCAVVVLPREHLVPFQRVPESVLHSLPFVRFFFSFFKSRRLSRSERLPGFQSYTNTVKVKCFYFFVRAVYFLAVHLDICRDLTCKRPQMCWGCTLTLHCVIGPVDSHTAAQESFTKRDRRFSAEATMKCERPLLSHYLSSFLIK